MFSKFSGIKNFLTFSKGERNGIIVLVLLIIVLIFAPLLYRNYATPASLNDSFFNSKVDSFFSSLRVKPDESLALQTNIIENEEVNQHKNTQYFYFDPNFVKVEEMVQLGLSVKQALVVEKYRAKGGVFRTPKDFAKVYVIDSSIYSKLKPWIRISPIALNSIQQNIKDTIGKVETKPIYIELNTTDTLELVKIKGIGQKFARRIIAYRSILGGYTNINQLTEVYGIKPELINEISKFISVDSAKIKTINLNLVSYDDLKKHPYLSEYQAKAIIYYRSKVGEFKNLNELIENKLLPVDNFVRFKKYLIIN